VKFEWENVSQITTSFGVLIFILLSLSYAGLSIIPGAFALILLEYTPELLEPYQQYLTYIILFCTLFVIAINIITTYISLAYAKKILIKKED